MYYVYALLDPRRPGPFKYGNWKFDFEPFYVGKGKDNRAFKHLDHTLGNCGNLHKVRKIAKIRRETNEEPVVLIKRKGLSEALSAYCRANPEKKRQASIKGHVTRKRL